MEIPEYLQWLENSFDFSRDVHRGYVLPDGALKDRSIKHDLMHLLIIGEERERPIRLKFEDEYANATVQAALEGRAKLSRIADSQRSGRRDPGHEVITEEVIRATTIPDSVEFLKWAYGLMRRELPGDFRTNVSSEFINQHIAIGKHFRRKFRERYGVEFISMDIGKLLRDIPFSDLQVLYAAAKEQATSPSAGMKRS